MSLEIDVLQFGFKKNDYTVICTSMLKETSEYCNENKTDCHLVLFDASKAFDRVEYYQLYTRLSDRNMCPIVLGVLINMYNN